MRNSVLVLSLFAAAVANAALKPTVWADIPDVAPLRVGDTYYMTSTTMHFNPGIPVMASKDLVDWKVVSYCYDTIESRAEDSLADGRNDYMFGTWASSIRYNEADGCFYVSSFNNRAKHTYLFRAKSAEGPWERFVFSDRLVYDHSLWIENGKLYFFGSNRGSAYLHRIKDDLSGIEPGEKLVCGNISRNLGGGLAEGSQVFKHGGWYYLVNICWPRNRCRLVYVHRSKSMEGPFEEAKVCFEREGIAQGSFVEKADGTWVAVLFGDRGGVGRIPFVLPVEWKDGWPIVQARDDYRATKAVPSCVAGDDFSSDKLKLEWQWNHNPDNANWKIADGALRITTSRVDKDLLTVRNTLTQRTFGPTCEATVKVDGSALKVGDKAGLSLFQHHWGAISLQKTEKGHDVVLDLPPLAVTERGLPRPKKGAATREVLRRGIGPASTVHLKAVCDFTPFANPDYRKIPASQDTGRFYYSLDGARWEALGEAMPLPYTIPHFTGYRFALFAWATKEAGGTAAFDDFAVAPAKPGETMKIDGSNPIVKTRFTADPAGYVDGDWFYLFTGHDDASAHGYRMFDYTMCRTKNMRDWEDFGTVLNLAEIFPWARADKAWASQVVRRGDKWYWYVATAHKHRRGDVIAVATADKPEGPWTDAAGENGLAQGWGFIDPSVFVDDDGSAWLFWGNCGGDPGCWYAKLKDSMVELDGGFKPVSGLMDPKAFGEPLVKKRGAGVRKNGAKNTNFEEAPWIYKVGDTYYLEYAAGGVPENWSYSTAKSIHGPWTYRGKIMDNAGGTGTIHGGSVCFKGRWYMVYHDGNLPGGADCRRSVCIEPYVRNPDGSIPFIRPTKEGVKLAPYRSCPVSVKTAFSAQDQDFNPILPDWIADPSVSKFGDTFYLYGTTDIDKELSMAGVPVVWTSKDFVNWSFEGPAIEGVDWQKNLGGYYRYWAPGKVIKTGDKYHLYVTIVDPRGRPAPTVLMVADRPEGPFRFAEKVAGEDAANGPLNRAQVAAAAVAPDIDGDPFVDDDGTAYIVWRKRWIAKLNAARTKIEGPHVALRTAIGGYSEGPCIFKRNGIYYYLYTIAGCDEYRYGYMMSKVSPLDGWTDPADPLVVESNYPGGIWGPGHGNVFESNGEYYLVYLEYGEGGTTRQVMANKLEFAEDGTIVRLVPNLQGVGYLGPNQEPRENLARRAMWTASSVRGPRLTRGRGHKDYTRTFAYDAQLAGDGDNGTRWVADDRDKTPWLQADFGKPTRVEEVKLFFTQPAFGHNWKLEGSLDGKTWQPLAEETAKPCRSPHVAKVGQEVRCLRISVTAGDPGVWEVKVY